MRSRQWVCGTSGESQNSPIIVIPVGRHGPSLAGLFLPIVYDSSSLCTTTTSHFPPMQHILERSGEGQRRFDHYSAESMRSKQEQRSRAKHSVANAVNSGRRRHAGIAGPSVAFGLRCCGMGDVTPPFWELLTPSDLESGTLPPISTICAR